MNGGQGLSAFHARIALLLVACGGAAAPSEAQTTFTFDNDCGSHLWNHCCAGVFDNVCTVWNNWMSPPRSMVGDCPACPASPGPGDDVVLDQFVNNDGTVAIRTLLTAAPFSNTGTLGVSTSAVYNSTVDAHGVFTGTGQHVFNGLVTGAGNTTFLHPATFTINAGLDAVSGVTISGDVTNVSGSTIRVPSESPSLGLDDAGSDPHDAVLHNQLGGLVLLEGDSGISALFTSGLVINSGVIRKSGGSGISELLVSLINNPAGRLEVQSGVMYASGASTMGGTVDISAGAAFRQGGTPTVPSSLTVTGLGEYQLVSQMAIAPGATVTVPRFTTGDSSARVVGGGRLTVTVAGVLDEMDLKESAQLSIAGGATASLGAGMYFDEPVGAGPLLSIGGTLNWLGGQITQTAGTIWVLPGGVWNLPDIGAVTGSFTSGAVLNEGTVRHSVAGNVSMSTGFENRGTVEVLAGRLGFASGRQTAGEMRLLGGSFTSSDASEPFLLQGGRLSGSGQFGGGLSNTGGTVAPGSSAGLISVTGGLNNLYAQSGAGVLEIEIGGTAPAQFDRLEVDGPAQLRGTLRVVRINSFTGGGQFDVLTVTAQYPVTGTFNTQDLPAGASVTYLPDRVRVTLNPACPADLGMQGGVPGHDGQLDNNDFIAFINDFFAHDPAADLGVAGGLNGSDGQFDNNDFIAFISRFFSGC